MHAVEFTAELGSDLTVKVPQEFAAQFPVGGMLRFIVLPPNNAQGAPEAAREVADWRADDETQRRLDELGEKANEGKLTPIERDEYEYYVRAIDSIGILQAKARAMLRHGSGS